MGKYFVTRIVMDVYSKGKPYTLRRSKTPLSALAGADAAGKVVIAVDEEGFSALSREDFIEGMSQAGAGTEDIDAIMEAEQTEGDVLNELEYTGSKAYKNYGKTRAVESPSKRRTPGGLKKLGGAFTKSAGGEWYEGLHRFNGQDYFFQAKAWPEGSKYGIDGSGVSKLVICDDDRWNPNKIIYDYDRGEGTNEAPPGLVDSLVAYIEDEVFMDTSEEPPMEEGKENLKEADEKNRFFNRYRCPYDGMEWEDESPYTNNDRCPECGAEVEPYESEDI